MDRFVYLGEVVTRNGDTSEGIKTRKWSRNSRFIDFDLVWKDIALSLKLNILLAIIWSVALNSSETWTIQMTLKEGV